MAVVAADGVRPCRIRVGATEGGFPCNPRALVARELTPPFVFGGVLTGGEYGAACDGHDRIVRNRKTCVRRALPRILEYINLLRDALGILVHREHRREDRDNVDLVKAGTNGAHVHQERFRCNLRVDGPRVAELTVPHVVEGVQNEGAATRVLAAP